MDLIDDITAETLLRLPPEEPEHLFRAALVCNPWCRLVSARPFRRRFRDRAGPAPMLGFLCNDVPRLVGTRAEALSTRFVRTAPSCPPLAARRGWHALDARAGRVLLQRSAEAPATVRLAV